MKTIIITGSSKGIGAAIATLAAKQGYNVVINYLTNQSRAEALAAELNRITACIAVKADVSDFEQAQALYAAAVKRFGKADVLVNNAAISQIKLFNDLSIADWQRMFDVNVNGVFNCTKAVLPAMLERKYGRIINIASMWGETGASCETAYSAGKAAVIGLTKALAKEVAPSGITVNCVSPGLIATEMNGGLDKEALDAVIIETPLGRIGLPDEIAESVLFFASEKAAFITGQVLGVNGGLLI